MAIDNVRLVSPQLNRSRKYPAKILTLILIGTKYV